MGDHQAYNQQIWRAAVFSVALGACLIFGIVVLAGGDGLPGGIIVAASIIGLAREALAIRQLCSNRARP